LARCNCGGGQGGVGLWQFPMLRGPVQTIKSSAREEAIEAVAISAYSGGVTVAEDQEGTGARVPRAVLPLRIERWPSLILYGLVQTIKCSAMREETIEASATSSRVLHSHAIDYSLVLGPTYSFHHCCYLGKI
ncbi:hypothetical protein PMAYCL1PPCAC_22695, partial [Pristionchus mayeri]